MAGKLNLLAVTSRMYGFVPGSTTLIVDDNGYCRAIELATGNTSTAPDLDLPEAAAIQQLLPLGVSSRACAGYVQSGCRDTVTRVLAGGVSRLSTGATVMTAEDSGQPSSELTITEHELAECKRVNATGRQPVVFVHGLWLLPSSWDRWATLFEENGYAALAPGWPDDPETVEEAKAHPEVFAGKSIGQVADHFETIIRGLDKKPAVIGHSFGGLLTQILAGRGLAAVSVAIDPAQFRGVLPLPISALKSAFPVLGNPANRNRAIPLTYDQFRYAFANAVSEEEAKQLHETYAVPTAGKPLFQAAAANFNPWTEAKVDTKNRERGPLLIISGEMDHTVPPAVVKAAYKQQQDNEGVTEIVEIKNRGHALTIDSGWREVAETALAFVKRFT